MSDSQQSPSTKKHRFGRSAASTFGNAVTKILIYPFSFAATVVVDRSLGAHDRGLFAFALLVGGFIMPLLTFGLGGSAVYAISSRKFEVRSVAVTILLMGVALGAITSAVTYVGWRFGLLGATGAQLSNSTMFAMLALAPIQSIQLMATRILFGESRFGTSNRLSIVHAVLNPLLLLLFVVVLPWGLQGAILGTIIVNLVTGTATVAAVLKNRPLLRYDHQFTVFALGYGWKIWIGDITSRANLRLDQMLLGIFATPEALGSYAVAVRLSELLWVFVDSVTPVLFNRMAASNDARRVELTSQVHRIGFWAMVVTSLAAGIVCYFAVPWLWGNQFRDARVLVQLLLPGTVALFTAKILTKFFGAAGRPELAGRIGVISGIAGASLYFVLIPLGDTLGAAIASSLSYAVMSLVAFKMFRDVIAPDKAMMFRVQHSDWQWLRGQLGRSARQTGG